MSKLPSLRTPDGPVKTLSEWREFARRDDCLARIVPSDLRCILSLVKEQDAEIERLRALNAEMREALVNMLHIMSSGVYRDSAGVKPSAHPDFDEAHAVLARAEREAA